MDKETREAFDKINGRFDVVDFNARYLKSDMDEQFAAIRAKTDMLTTQEDGHTVSYKHLREEDAAHLGRYDRLEARIEQLEK